MEQGCCEHRGPPLLTEMLCAFSPSFNPKTKLIFVITTTLVHHGSKMQLFPHALSVVEERLKAHCCSHSSRHIKTSEEDLLILSSPQWSLPENSFFPYNIGRLGLTHKPDRQECCKDTDSFCLPSSSPKLPLAALPLPPPPMNLKVSLSYS